MQSPLVIGLASILPGLGLLIMGQTRLAIGTFVVVLGLFGLAFLIPIQFIAQLSFQFAFFAWAWQIYYALQLARRSKQHESGEMKMLPEFAPVPLPTGDLTPSERYAYQNRESLRQQLLPGEHLRDAIVALFMPSSREYFSRGATASFSIHSYYVGVTQNDLITLDLDVMGKPVELKRIPISEVKKVDFKANRIGSDQLTITIGMTPPLKLRVSRKLRSQTENIVSILQADGGV